MEALKSPIENVVESVFVHVSDLRRSADTPRVLFMYKTSDIEAAFRYLQEQDVNPLYPIESPHPGLTYFIFTDPDGNSIMVTQSDYVSDIVQRMEHADSPILNKIDSIFISVRDMNRAIRFHSGVLGLPYHEVEPGRENSIYDLQMNSGSGIMHPGCRCFEGIFGIQGSRSVHRY